MNIEEIRKGAHNNKIDKLVRDTLREVGKLLEIGYSKSVDLFKNGDDQVTVKFWDILYSNPENIEIYNSVDFHYCCKKFNLYHVKGK